MRTRADYQKIFDYLKPLDGDLLVNIDQAYTLSVRDAAFAGRKRHFANYVVTVLRLPFAWGALHGLADKNAANRPEIAPAARRADGEPALDSRRNRDRA